MTLWQRVSECRSAFAAVAVTSGVVNILYLTASIFMMQVYDRVLGSQSIPTLIALSLFAVAAYLFQGVLDMLRQRMIARIAEHVEEGVAPELCRILVVPPGIAGAQRPDIGRGQETLQLFRDLDAVRGFAVGGGMLAILDAPWMPIYLAFLFFLSPLLGWTCIAGAVVLTVLAVITELSVRAPARASAEQLSERNQLAEGAQHGAEVIRAMGMGGAIIERWQRLNAGYLDLQRRAHDRSGGLAAASRSLRYVLQSTILGLAAYLAVRGEISAGSIVTSTILAARALSPVDQSIVHWRGFLAARRGWARLSAVLKAAARPPAPLALPAPKRDLKVEQLFVGAAGRATPIVSNISVTVPAGSALGIVGPSASGKSTLAGALVGVRRGLKGRILIDGAPLEQWDAELLGRHVGYLPQDVQLFDGTIRENISRFAANPSPAAIIEAAEAADFHRHILDMPAGYDTRIGRGGCFLSTGQRQRLGLARALYGDPFLVVLDEPNANLDAEGEQAVSNAIARVRARGGIVVVIAHRPSVLQSVDLVLVLRNGEVAACGPRDDIVRRGPVSVVRNAPRPEITTAEAVKPDPARLQPATAADPSGAAPLEA